MTPLDQRKGKMAFRLQRMGEIYEEAQGAVDEAHRHDYYTVLLVGQAQGQHIIDYHAYDFGSKEVHFVSPGQVHQVAVTHPPDGVVMTFTRAFLMENNIPQRFISNINLFQTFDNTPPLKLDDATYERLSSIISEMETCLELDLKYGGRAAGALLQLFLIYANNSAILDQSQTDEESTSVCILRDFKTLVEERFRTWHKVKDYAEEIHITPKHLSQTIKHVTGKVAKAHIQDRLILEAKRLLLHTDQNIKEIAHEIGFDEPMHFSGFFKRQVGVSPRQFREGQGR